MQGERQWECPGLQPGEEAAEQALQGPAPHRALQEALQLQELPLPEAVLRVLRQRALLPCLQLRGLLQQPGERELQAGSCGDHPGPQPQRLPAQDPGHL